MNLTGVTSIRRPRSADEIGDWPDGHAWLAGGTWLFSEPQTATDTLVDLDSLGWPALGASSVGLDIAATCRIAELHRFSPPAEWTAAPLIRECCEAFLASLKIWNSATVGGNICLSLPAGPMTSLAVALEATLVLWPRGGEPRTLPALEFVTGNHANVLGRGELLRSIRLPVATLTKRHAFRHGSLTQHGRSAALIVGTIGAEGCDFVLTLTAATPRPVQIRFATSPTAEALAAAIEAAVDPGGWFDDVNGAAAYKRRLAFHFAEEIRRELAAEPAAERASGDPA